MVDRRALFLVTVTGKSDSGKKTNREPHRENKLKAETKGKEETTKGKQAKGNKGNKGKQLLIVQKRKPSKPHRA